MNKKEVTEIKKLFTKERCCLNRLCGCYVDADKNKVVQFKEAFLSLPEEEIYKYLDIFRKSLSGTLGKNLLNMEFPLEQEMGDGTQKSLLALRDSELKDDVMLDAFYDRMIETYYHPENYLILLVHGSYDIPMKTSDGMEMDDASDYIYNFVLCCLCPVTLSKAGLCYNAETNSIEDRIRDWMVDLPEQGFLFPAFQDRNTDIHRLLYYSKNANELCPDITEQLLGCVQPIPAGQQKESFQAIIEDTLGEECVYDVVRNIHENLNEMIEEQKENGEPLELDKMQVRKLLERSGAPEENLEQFRKEINEKSGITPEDLNEKIAIDMQLPFEYVNEKFIGELAVLEPFGKGNARPVFAERQVQVESARILGKNKNVLKLQVKDLHGTRMDAMYFGDVNTFVEYVREKFGDIACECLLHGHGHGIVMAFTYYPDINEYQGVRKPQIVIQNYK